jgi:hypothetical protein
MTFKSYFRTLPALALALAGSVSSVRASELASATISSIELTPTTWQYDITLDDTGTTNVGTFWFSWVPGEDFMPTSPISVVSPAGWTDNITHGGSTDGYAIQWLAGSGDALTAGNSLPGFEFVSTVSPTQMAGDSPLYPGSPVETAFVYSGAPFSDAGAELTVQPAASSSVPEPASVALVACGGILLMLARRRQHRRSDEA